jgi:cell division protein FtsW
LAFGSHVNDASRWIKIPFVPLSFQPSDIAKFALLLYLARLLAKRQEVITDLRKGFGPVILPVLITFGLILPANFSTAAILLITSLVVIFFGRASLKHIFSLLGIMIVAVGIFIMVAKLIGYDGRISTWTNRAANFGSAEKKEVSFQTQQANIAIANGSWTGLGPGNSKQCNYLPHAYSDFIFATIVEEYGMLGAAFVILLYMIFLFRCIKIFRKCNGAFGGFLVLGLGFSLTIQAIMHMAVNVHLFPVTGITLPFLSKGGTSFLMTCISAGIILSVSRYIENPEDLNPEMETASVEPIANNLATEHLAPTPMASPPAKNGDPF